MKYNEFTKLILQFPNENWKPVEDNPIYEISDLGRLRKTFKNGRTKIFKPQIKKYPNNRFYYYFKINCKNRYVHQLVLKHFVGDRPEGFDCDHIDRNTANNTLSNLRYLPISENRSQKGMECSWAKLTDNEVMLIRKMYSCGSITYESLANLFEISKSQIRRIITLQQWCHI